MRESFKRYIPKIIGKYLNALAIVKPFKAAKLAFGLFSKPRLGSIGLHHQEFLDPARKEKISVKDLKIQTYHWEGSGKTVLLVHGWESHTHRWKDLILRLQSQDYNIIAFDAPAHGYSSGARLYVPLYEEVLQQLIKMYSPTYTIGHSVGAMTTMYNQHRHHNPSIAKMVVLGPPNTLNTIIDEFKRILSLNNKVIKALDAYMLKRFGFKINDFASERFSSDIQIPGLIIHDKDDKITQAEGSRAIHKSWPTSKLIETTGLNHSLYSDEVNDSIIQFLEEEST